MSKVLIVEDDKYLSKLIADTLLLEGFEVKCALDGEAGWELLNKAESAGQYFDVAIIDMLLPKLMGAELLTKIRESGKGAALRCIAMSGVYRGKEEIARLRELHHLEAYLTKPFHLGELSALITGKNVSKQTETQKGKLSDRPIERLFFDSYCEAFTGLIEIRWNEGRRKIYFSNGHPVGAESSALEENFGAFLVSAEIITKETREEASVRMSRENVFFGEMLIRMGALKKDELFKALRKHSARILINAVLTRTGEYEMRILETLPQHIPHIEFNPFLLMLEAQKRMISTDALASLFRIKQNLYPEKSARFTQILSSLNFPEEKMRLLMSLSGAEELQNFLKRMSKDFAEQSLRILYLMESVGLLEWKDAAVEQASDQIESVEFSYEPKTQTQSDDEIFSYYMDTLNQNFFQLLGVSDKATKEEIENAYREKRYGLHPDRYQNALSDQSKRILGDILARLDKAYQTLIDSSLRSDYVGSIKKHSQDSAADSKRFLTAQDVFREGLQLLQKERYQEAQIKFESAHQTWHQGIEYKMYAYYAEFRALDPERNAPQATKVLTRLREVSQSNPHAEVGLILIGHCLKTLKQWDGARDAYRKALGINPQSEEASNALTSIAGEGVAGPSLKRFLPNQNILKRSGLTLFMLIVFGLCFYFRDALIRKDPDVLEIDPLQFAKIFDAKIVRVKKDMAKITIKEGSLNSIPEPVLKSKCSQLVKEIQKFGADRIYLLDEKEGLKAFCSTDGFQKL